MVQKCKNFFLFLCVNALVLGWGVAEALAFAVPITGGNTIPGIVGGGGGAAGGGAAAGGGGTTLGNVIDNLRANTADSTINLFEVGAYLMGLLLGATAIVKLKAHVESPSQTPLSDSMKRFAAGGAFFALPYVVSVVRQTIEGNGGNYSNTGFNGTSSGAGLDAMIVNLMVDVFLPLQWIFGAFGWVAGIALVMIGISRLLKSEQEGPRGPAGIGTIMTFVAAGCLFSLSSLIGFFTATLFPSDVLQTNGVLQYATGLGDSVDHVHAVISALIAFAIIIGWVSLIRGFFILRGVSEGNSQASMMGAMTHLIGGVLAINLGSVINAVQSTLGITQYGIQFN